MEPLASRAKVIARNPADDSDESSGLPRATSVFLEARPRLFGIACRILRDASEADDIIQDAWIRWQRTDRTAVRNAEAFLVTTTTRLALNDARSARHRRETPASPWVSEMSASGVGPESSAERSEALEHAVMVLLTTLTPAERAAYVVREAFDYPYDRIAELLQLDAAHCRQLVRRARQHIASERQRPVSLTAHRQLLATFLAAAQDGKIAGLESLLVAGTASTPAPRPGDYDPAAA